MRFGSIWPAAKAAGLQWVAHKDARMGAALSYYSVFSIGPLIVIAVAVAGFVFGREAVQGQVTDALRGLLGESGAQAVNGMLASADRPREGIIATIFGIVTYRKAGTGIDLRRRVLARRRSDLGLLLGSNRPARRGVHAFSSQAGGTRSARPAGDGVTALDSMCSEAWNLRHPQAFQ